MGLLLSQLISIIETVARPLKAVDTKITIYGISVSDRIPKQHYHGEACKASTGVPRSQEIAPPPRTVTGAYAQAYCRVLGGGSFL